MTMGDRAHNPRGLTCWCTCALWGIIRTCVGLPAWYETTADIRCFYVPDRGHGRCFALVEREATLTQAWPALVQYPGSCWCCDFLDPVRQGFFADDHGCVLLIRA